MLKIAIKYMVFGPLVGFLTAIIGTLPFSLLMFFKGKALIGILSVAYTVGAAPAFFTGLFVAWQKKNYLDSRANYVAYLLVGTGMSYLAVCVADYFTPGTGNLLLSLMITAGGLISSIFMYDFLFPKTSSQSSSLEA